jgi:uncharacterized membrane protein
MNLAKYRKTVVALTGAAVVVATQVAGVTVAEGVSDAVVGVFDSVVVLLTALGVRQVPNEQ